MRNLKFVLLVAFGLLFGAFSAQASSDVVGIYKEGRYSEVVKMLEPQIATLDNTSLYHLALSYAQLKNDAEAISAFQLLLARDPAFYAYKISYDLDLSDFLSRATSLQNANASVALSIPTYQSQFSKDRLVVNDGRIYLFRNGLKLYLGDAEQVSQVEFLNDRLVAFKLKNKKDSEFVVFDGGNKMFLLKQDTKLDEYMSYQRYGNLLIGSHGEGFFVYNEKDNKLVNTWLPGRFSNYDPETKSLTYSDKKGDSFTMSLAY